MKKLIYLFVMVMLLSRCATLPGSIRESVSGFDKTKEIKMEPAWAGNSLRDDPIGLGLYKTSKMDIDKVILIVGVKGAFNFSPKESLQFNIDGNIVTLDSMDTTTNIELREGVYNSVAYIPASNWSSKRYEVTKDLIKKLIDGKEVWVKVNLSQEHFESKFSVDVPMGARTSFRKFYKKVWGAN